MYICNMKIIQRQFYKYSTSVDSENNLFVVSNGSEEMIVSYRQFEEINSLDNEDFMESIDELVDDVDNFEWVGIELPNDTKLLFRLKGSISDVEFKINDTQDWDNRLEIVIADSNNRVFDDNNNLIK